MPALSGPATRFQVDPRLILLAGSLIALVALGMRHSFGLFLGPVTGSLPAVDRETFGFAIALQNLMWGIAQPFAGMIADRFGSARVIFAGGLLYAGGLLCASAASTSLGLVLGLGVLVGIGLSATSYAVVLGAVGRRFPPERRSSALGVASLGGSLGIFLSVPVTLSLIDAFSWPLALVSLALVAATICALAPVLSGRSVEPGADQSLRSALSEALSHRGFVLLVLGFFVCGFQLAFIGTHLPAYLLDRHLPAWVGGAALATIGATNIAGTFICGLLGDHLSKKKILVILYLARAAAVALFVLFPPSDISTLVFAAVMGFTWLGTVPLTTGIVAQIFGARYLATLVGIVFLMHQTGSFLGAWLGGLVFERTGSYDIMWWSVVASGVVAALVHLPIDERPLAAKDRVFGNALSNA
ncbi:MFS transporter [Roseibium sp.]|uniref:MFS transporter n=1 Tax=Roseibium sp. TaxID=1936156 RepID=UPI003BAC693C